MITIPTWVFAILVLFALVFIALFIGAMRDVSRGSNSAPPPTYAPRHHKMVQVHRESGRHRKY